MNIILDSAVLQYASIKAHNSVTFGTI